MLEFVPISATSIATSIGSKLKTLRHSRVSTNQTEESGRHEGGGQVNERKDVGGEATPAMSARRETEHRKLTKKKK